MNNNVFRNLSYGVYIISCEDNGRYTGCTVNSIMQITSNPAKIALSLNHDNYTHSCICKSKKFAVSILSFCLFVKCSSLFELFASFINFTLSLTVLFK